MGERAETRVRSDRDEKLDKFWENVQKPGVEAIVDEKLLPVNKKLDVLLCCNPTAALTSMNIPLVEKDRSQQTKSILHGAPATWTYIRSGTDVLAVSCEHCALAYGTKRAGCKIFVSLPQELVSLGVKWVGLLPSHKFGSVTRRDHEDIAIVRLEKLPDGLDVKSLPLWMPFQVANPRDLASAVVAGMSNTATVSGSHWSYRDGTRLSIIFVEQSGEAGNSGTLMFLLHPDGKEPTVVGVYLGVKNKNSKGDFDLHCRGRICPLPDLTEFEEHYVCDAPLQTFSLWKKLTNTYKKFAFGVGAFRKVYAEPSVYGVFIEDPRRGEGTE